MRRNMNLLITRHKLFLHMLDCGLSKEDLLKGNVALVVLALCPPDQSFDDRSDFLCPLHCGCHPLMSDQVGCQVSTDGDQL